MTHKPPSSTATSTTGIKLTAIAFISCLGLIGLLSVVQYQHTEWGSEHWLDGQQTELYETRFDNSFPLKQFSVGVWAAIELVLFNQARPGVTIGHQDWLFSSEELAVYPAAQDATSDNLAQIDRIAGQLASQNIAVIVAVVPAKARIYSEHLPNGSLYPATVARHEIFVDWLATKQIPWVSFKEPLLAAKTQQPVFLKTDTHWTPFGARVAATHLQQFISTQFTGLINPTDQFKTTVTDPQPFEGDLMSFIPVRDLFPGLGPSADWLSAEQTELIATTDSASENSLFTDQPDFDITLVGTSYSANDRWNFQGALQQATGQQILNYAELGVGPIKPMLNYLASNDFQQSPPRLIIWEFPERFLPVANPAAALTEASSP